MAKEYLIAHSSLDPFGATTLVSATMDSLSLLSEEEYEALQNGTVPDLTRFIGPFWRLVEAVDADIRV